MQLSRSSDEVMQGWSSWLWRGFHNSKWTQLRSRVRLPLLVDFFWFFYCFYVVLRYPGFLLVQGRAQLELWSSRYGEIADHGRGAGFALIGSVPAILLREDRLALGKRRYQEAKWTDWSDCSLRICILKVEYVVYSQLIESVPASWSLDKLHRRLCSAERGGQDEPKTEGICLGLSKYRTAMTNNADPTLATYM